MFMQTIQITVVAVLQVVLLALGGYFAFRRKILDETGLYQLSGLVINFLLPLFIYDQMTANFSFADYPDWWKFPLLSFGVSLAGFLVGKGLAFFLKGFSEENEFLVLMSFQNAGNIPMIVATALFGHALTHQLYVYIFLFILGFNIILWTIGISMLLKQRLREIPLSRVFNPPFVAIVVTMTVIALGWHKLVPEMILKPVKLLGDCTLPLAIMLVGGNLAAINLREVHSKAIGLFILGKMIILPILALFLVSGLQLPFAAGFLIVVEAAVPSAVSLSIMARYFGAEGRFVNQGLFFGHLVCIVTLPLFLSIYMKLAGY